MNMFGVPIACWYRAPVVLSSQRAYRTLTPGLRHHFLRWTDRLVDGIVVNCEAMRTHLVEDGVNEGLIHLCYNGIDTAAFQPEGPRIAEPALDDAAGVVGVVCQMRPEKGLETLVEGFARSGAAGRNWKLALVGSGVMVEKVLELARQLNLGDSVITRPSTTRVAEWLRRLDIFVLPSLSEALSNSIMEAMACGCAVVASRVGGNVELAQEGITGLTFEPGNSVELAARLRTLVEDTGLRLKLAEAGREFIHRNFTLANASQTMAAIYDQALAH